MKHTCVPVCVKADGYLNAISQFPNDFHMFIKDRLQTQNFITVLKREREINIIKQHPQTLCLHSSAVPLEHNNTLCISHKLKEHANSTSFSLYRCVSVLNDVTLWFYYIPQGNQYYIII